jgi:hypothetical protein
MSKHHFTEAAMWLTGTSTDNLKISAPLDGCRNLVNH